MLLHTVAFSLNPETLPTSAREHLSLIKQRLEALTAAIPQLIGMEVVVNENGDEVPAFLLRATVASYQDLQTYATHPAHVAVVKELIAPYKTARVCVDYEL